MTSLMILNKVSQRLKICKTALNNPKEDIDEFR